MRRVLELPLIVILMGICALMMYLPVFHAVTVRDWLSARSFFYAGTLFLTLVIFLGVATYHMKPRSLARSHLTALVAAYGLLPFMLAWPFYEAVQNTSFFNAWFEMVSSLTTTGATLFEPERLRDTLHLWRATVGWMGGLFIWVTAAAIMAPLNLGGFEVTSMARPGSGAKRDRVLDADKQTDPRERLLRLSLQMGPVYIALTGVLWIALVGAGEDPLIAICHAMSVLSTSGISPVGGLSEAQSGMVGEALILCFFVFAFSRKSFSPGYGMGLDRVNAVYKDIEARMAIYCIILVPSALFLRHWIGAFEVDDVADVGAALRALWGAVFSVASFLTTTGFTSGEWGGTETWSGLQTPGMVLMGLALVGGGVATTAGGVKLLRVYALYKHGHREIEKLVHPHSVSGAGGTFGRHIRRQGAYIAWLFFMLYALSLAGVSGMLAATGLSFEQSMILSLSGLSTAGQLAEVGGDAAISYVQISDTAKAILAGAMVLGRVEALALIALLNPEFWRA
ncbi:MAG: TrkH family potassium uptake protein [Vannielia sp.]|uniref:TrkH family potassium uptake protein n=1 Tax=Rhodobacterales TaxID=204455 RepID=UPI0020941AEC|nr:potassium transporter TrkG [Oceanicola sp. 502str15]MCO6382142.1 TrkH family potassium uptake protein [Oceanicola sp. 502str15]